MKHWWVGEDETLKQGQKLVPTHRLKTPYKLLVAMLYRLYGEEKSKHFQIDWIPLAHIVVKTRHIFNWEDILAFKIFLHAKNFLGSEAFKEMVRWQDGIQPTPTSLPIYSKRERIRYQMLFDTNKPLSGSVCSTQGVVSNTFAQLWKNVNDIVAEAGIQPLQSIDETTSINTRMVEVEDLKKFI